MSRQLNPSAAGKAILKLKVGERIFIPKAACPQGLWPSGPGTMGVGDRIFEMSPTALTAEPTGVWFKRVH